ncbi:retrovirus-related pol polyprotein from transposon TNT 1-94 [Tanacetum coccineum]
MEELPCRQFRENKIRGMQAVSNATWVNRTGGTNTAGQAKVIHCYNCQEECHMERQCTKPKRPRNSTWFKEKVMLVEALESGMEIPTPAAFQTVELDAFDSDCVEAPSASAVPMAKLSLYDSEVLSEVPIHDNYLDNHVIDQNVREM